MINQNRSAAAGVGPDALGAAFEAIDRAAAGWCAAPLVVAKARGLMAGYHARWAAAGWETLGVEPVFDLPIINPATGRRSRTFRQAGRCDGLIARRGRRYLLKVKTTAEEIVRPGVPFWRRLLMDGQSGLYALAQRQQGRPVAGTLYDVLRRPVIRPRGIPRGRPAETDPPGEGTLAEIRRRGTYFGRALSAGQRRAALGHARETPELFALRLAADTLRRPGWYFQRRIVVRSRQQLAHQAAELWQTADEIRCCRHGGRHYRNSDACMPYGVACPFLPICSGRVGPDSDRFRRQARIHPELAPQVAAADERQVLTHSRIRCFRLCRRKHYFRYELGIAPVEPTRSESFLLGRLIREATGAWWRSAGNGK